MAIQLPDVGTGVPADQTGDSPWLAMKKVRENFTNTTHAASKLVGDTNGKIPTWEQSLAVRYPLRAGGSGNMPEFPKGTTFDIAKNTVTGYKYFWDINDASSWADLTAEPYLTGWQVIGYQTSKLQIGFDFVGNNNVLLRTSNTLGNFSGANNGWVKVYTTGNTTKDSNGFIKAASPIVKVFADKVELNDDAINQNVSYKKNGIGDYTIVTESGLSTDGWYIELPKDMNGNPKVAVTLSEVDGVISLKSYKRIFSMETFTFEPDLSEPLDIPEGRWVDLRLNEIPFEMPDDTQTEV